MNEVSNEVPSWYQIPATDSMSKYTRRINWEHVGPSLHDFAAYVEADLDRVLRNPPPFFYLNPKWKIIAWAPMTETEFLAHAKSACIDWKKSLTMVLRPVPLKTQIRRMSVADRTKLITGFLMIHGKPAHPKRIQ